MLNKKFVLCYTLTLAGCNTMNQSHNMFRPSQGMYHALESDSKVISRGESIKNKLKKNDKNFLIDIIKFNAKSIKEKYDRIGADDMHIFTFRQTLMQGAVPNANITDSDIQSLFDAVSSNNESNINEISDRIATSMLKAFEGPIFGSGPIFKDYRPLFDKIKCYLANLNKGDLISAIKNYTNGLNKKPEYKDQHELDNDTKISLFHFVLRL
ncbi:hypothetical protein [Cardinium endosymbiont of Nabis limbatus]|uniref:hypothetical protein n=1 Tax=Cardinium endosymbiont of Nabis limbatus TaxID=3066217 RepID=UPI003AF3596D